MHNIRFRQQKDINPASVFEHIVPIVALAVIAVISYLIFFAPILYGDDWSFMIGRWYYGTMHWFDLGESRPLMKLPHVILYGIFGLNLHAFYAILWILNVLAAILIYFLMLKLIPKNKPVAFAITALVLVYPADFTHMWLTLLYIRLIVVVTLIYAYLLLIYADTGRKGALWVALFSLIFSLGTYEGQLGIALAWCLLLAVVKRIDFRRRLSLLLPLGIGLGFIVWRTFAYFALINSYGYERNMDYLFQPTLRGMIERLIKGYQVLVWAWIEPFIHALGLNPWQALLVVLTSVVIGSLVAYWLTQKKLPGANLTTEEHLGQLRRFVVMMLCGPIFIAAGYFPFIAVFQPTFYPNGSRLSMFALIGATITIAAMLAIVVLRFSRKQSQINFTIMTGMVPLIMLGMLVQAKVQHDDQSAWAVQKQIWHDLFELAPDLKDGTGVLFILPDKEAQTSWRIRRVQRPILNSNADVGSALNILYGKYNLTGEVLVDDTQFLITGVKHNYSDKVMPYERLAVVAYDGSPKRLRIVKNLESENLVDFPVENYAPYEHILEIPTERDDLRWLVGATSDE